MAYSCSEIAKHLKLKSGVTVQDVLKDPNVVNYSITEDGDGYLEAINIFERDVQRDSKFLKLIDIDTPKAGDYQLLLVFLNFDEEKYFDVS